MLFLAVSAWSIQIIGAIGFLILFLFWNFFFIGMFIEIQKPKKKGKRKIRWIGSRNPIFLASLLYLLFSMWLFYVSYGLNYQYKEVVGIIRGVHTIQSKLGGRRIAYEYEYEGKKIESSDRLPTGDYDKELSKYKVRVFKTFLGTHESWMDFSKSGY